MAEEKMIKEQLTELLDTYYNGSFLQMVCEYIRFTGMTQEEVEELLEAIREVWFVTGVTRRLHHSCHCICFNT